MMDSSFSDWPVRYTIIIKYASTIDNTIDFCLLVLSKFKQSWKNDEVIKKEFFNRMQKNEDVINTS